MWRLVAVFLLWPCAFCSAAGFPLIMPGCTYTDGVILLQLMDRHFFALTAAEKGSPLNVTGIWRQTRGGALLQLTNRNGFSLILNVGGAGDLYGDFPRGDMVPRAGMLRPMPRQSGHEVPFLLEGTLAGTGDSLTLTDAASGLAFRVRDVRKGGGILPDHDPAVPLFVTVRAHVRGSQLFPVQILAQSPQLPPVPRPESFARAAGRVGWLLILPDLPPLSCFFTPAAQDGSDPQKGEKGLLEVTGQGLRFQTEYAAKGSRLRVRVDQKDAVRLAAVGAEAIPAFFRNVSGWMREGEVLILTGRNDRQQILEKGR